ncbi:MAG TPA: hypothetical protein VFS43_38635 [Polyangiaceae bacterium]|nr:hypothetical protein [Polyangiaceae bacterium]
MVSQAGRVLAGIAFARASDKEVLTSLASNLAWPPCKTVSSAWIVFHHSDPSFGAGTRR